MAIVSTGQLTLTDLNDTKQLILYLNPNYRTQIYDPNAGTYTPSFASTNLIIKPELYVAGGDGTNIMPNGGTPVANAQVKSIAWYAGSETIVGNLIADGASGADYTIASGTASTTDKKLTVKTNFTAKNNQVFSCVVVYTDPDTNFDVTLKGSVDIVKITNGQKGDGGDAGQNALTAILSNESHGIPTAWDGTSPVYTNSGTTIRLFEGTTELTYDGVGTANGSWKVVATGTGITAGAITDSGLFATVAVASAITADQASISFAITGKRADGTAISLTKVQTFTKVKNGQAGTTPTAYWMTLSSHVIQKTEAGVFSPTSIVATGYKQVGTGTPTSDASYKFRIDYDNGSGFVNGTPSASAVATATTTAYNAGLKAIRFRMYQSTVTPSDTNFIDESIVMVVKDGNTGASAFFLNVWTPEGDTIRNGSGSLKIKADLYEGGIVRTPSAFKWYIQNPLATTASLGDTDGGNGWELIIAGNAGTLGITNYTTAEITVQGTAISGVEGFKCVATYASLNPKPSGVTVVKDFQDPISVNILGANIFKNGEGSVTLTAQLLRAGVEIPTTGYTFAWAVYNTNGTLNKALVGATDTITVDATDVNGIGNIVCDVSK